MNTDQLRESVKQVVSKSLNEKLEEAVTQRLSIFEEKDEECDKKSSKTAVGSGDDDDEDAEGGDGGGAVSESDDGESEDDEDDESEDDDEEDDELKETLGEDLKEALKVVAMPSVERSKGAKGKAEDIEVKDLRELTKLAKTGQYDYFTVTKRNGEEDEYHVSKGKLVLM